MGPFCKDTSALLCLRHWAVGEDLRAECLRRPFYTGNTAERPAEGGWSGTRLNTRSMPGVSIDGVGATLGHEPGSRQTQIYARVRQSRVKRAIAVLDGQESGRPDANPLRLVGSDGNPEQGRQGRRVNWQVPALGQRNRTKSAGVNQPAHEGR